MGDVLDLFAGGGGAGLGLERAGWRHLAAVEWVPAACATLRAAGLPAVEADIRTLDFSPWAGRADLLWASPPCQAGSAASKRRGVNDDRNGWPWTLRAIREVRPTWALREVQPYRYCDRGMARFPSQLPFLSLQDLTISLSKHFRARGVLKGDVFQLQSASETTGYRVFASNPDILDDDARSTLELKKRVCSRGKLRVENCLRSRLYSLLALDNEGRLGIIGWVCLENYRARNIYTVNPNGDCAGARSFLFIVVKAGHSGKPKLVVLARLENCAATAVAIRAWAGVLPGVLVGAAYSRKDCQKNQYSLLLGCHFGQTSSLIAYGIGAPCASPTTPLPATGSAVLAAHGVWTSLRSRGVDADELAAALRRTAATLPPTLEIRP